MKYGKTFTEALREISKIQEDGHTDVASAVRQCKTAIEDASEMLSKLQGMNPEGDLPSWWMNKIAIAANSMNKLRDYLLVPSTANEDFADINRKRGDEYEIVIVQIVKQEINIYHLLIKTMHPVLRLQKLEHRMMIQQKKQLRNLKTKFKC